MVRKATSSGVDSLGPTNPPAGTDSPAKADSGGKAPGTRRTRRKPVAEGAAPAAAPTKSSAPSFADSQRPLPDGTGAAPQRPDPHATAAADASTFEGTARAAARLAGEAYGTVRDTVLKGADRVGGLTSEKGLQDAADAALGVAGRNKGLLAAGAALVVGGVPAVAVTLGAAARTAKLVADGKDPVAAGQQVLGEINELAEKAPERAAQIAGQAAEIAGQAKDSLAGWAARFGTKKD